MTNDKLAARLERLERNYERSQELSQRMFLSVATIHQLLLHKDVLTRAEYDAQIKVVEARYQKAVEKIQEEDLAIALQALLDEHQGPIQ